jgi:uncharacterized protein with FMN-binding domain
VPGGVAGKQLDYCVDPPDCVGPAALSTRAKGKGFFRKSSYDQREQRRRPLNGSGSAAMDTTLSDKAKKVALSAAVVVLFALYALQKHAQSTGGTSEVAGVSVTASSVNASTISQPAATYRDGIYTGDSIDAIWGDVEVQATIAGGKIGGVQVVTYPNHRERSREINQRALPILTKEVVQSQRAEVDTVTGATDTSDAFVYSLESALARATA